MSRSLLRTLLLALGLAVVVSGCQRRPTFTFALVEGTITKSGRPLANVQVVFYVDPDAGTVGPQASGFTDKAGHYRLQGDLIRGEPPPPDGAVVGKHRVCLLDPPAKPQTLLDPPAKPETPLEKRRVPPRYGSFTETPLRAEVHPGPQTLNFDIP